MAGMTDMLEQLLGGQADQIGARIGADPATTQSAIAAALPALLAGLQGQAAPGTGLERAIAEDHDGSILDDLPGYLQGTANLSSRTTNGEGILKHVLGDQQEGVQQALSAKTGLSLGSIAQLLPLLAPLVMGMLGKQARTQGSAASTDTGGFSLDALGGLLGGLRGNSAGGSGAGPGGAGGGLGDVLGSILGPRGN